MRNVCLKLVMVFLMGLIFCVAGENALAASPEEGYWKSIDDKMAQTTAIWQLIVKDGMLRGYMVNYKGMKPGDVCTACQGDTAAWSGKPLCGTAWMKMTLKGSSGVWEDGYIIDSGKGKKYKAKVWVEGEVLKVRGYLGFLYSTQSWKKATKVEAEASKF